MSWILNTTSLLTTNTKETAAFDIVDRDWLHDFQLDVDLVDVPTHTVNEWIEHTLQGPDSCASKMTEPEVGRTHEYASQAVSSEYSCKPNARPIQMGEVLRKYFVKRWPKIDATRINQLMVEMNQWGMVCKDARRPLCR